MPQPLRRTLIRAVLFHLAAALAVGGFLLLAHVTEHAGLLALGECNFRRFLGLYCPGCGATRSLLALFSGHPLRACLLYPAFVPAAFLVLWYDFLLALACFRRDASYLARFPWKSLLSIPICAVVVALLRNILLLDFGIDTLGSLL